MSGRETGRARESVPLRNGFDPRIPGGVLAAVAGPPRVSLLPVLGRTLFAWEVPVDASGRRLAGPGLVLALILVAAAFVRCYGIWFTPPETDEPHIVLRALKFGTGDLNPHNFDWPASLLMYLTFGALALYFVAGRASGAFASAQDFGQQYFADNSGFYLVARILPALMGVATVYMVYLCARRFWNQRAALAGAAVFAFAPLAVIHSHFVLADVPCVLFVTLGLFYALRILDGQGRTWDYVGAGVSVGLAASMKYNGALAVISPLVAHVILSLSRRHKPLLALIDRKLWIMAGSAAASFLVTCPFALLDFSQFRKDLAFQFLHQIKVEPHVGAGVLGSPHWNLAKSLRATVGLIPYLAALVGVGLVVWIKKWRSLLLIAFASVYFLVNGLSRVFFWHYSLPLVPYLSILAGVTLSETARVLPWTKWRGAAVAVLCAVSVGPGLLSGWDYVRELALPDTRILCRRWVEEHVPPGGRIAVEDPAVELLHTPASIERNYQEAAGQGVEGRARYFRNLSLFAADLDYPAKYDLFWIYDFTVTENYFQRLQALGVEWFIYSRPKEEKYEREVTRREYPDAARWRQAFYEALRAQGKPLVTIEPVPGKTRGPLLAVYLLTPTGVAGRGQ